MKKTGTLNSHLSQIIAAMGHSDHLVICDSGLPIPRSAELVDLALTRNIPGFLDTLRVVLDEAEIEGAIIAAEMETANPEIFRRMKEALQGIPVRRIAHEEFKRMLRNGEGNTAFVRTGEATPYANVILIAGVNFD
jgi:D-ribose pyranase